uniref:Uncharacterized protein n=1 Tax=Podoviridae sp. ctoqT5 TaxID=2826577 RepID=A0A8S5MPE6_9CAUD|nr:MAG TPA: hypothetical protein [Podoviridae sp. ctoqT5]
MTHGSVRTAIQITKWKRTNINTAQTADRR